MREDLATLDENIADMTRTLLRRVDRLGGDVQAWQDARVLAMDADITTWKQRRERLAARQSKRPRRTA